MPSGPVHYWVGGGDPSSWLINELLRAGRWLDEDEAQLMLDYLRSSGLKDDWARRQVRLLQHGNWGFAQQSISYDHADELDPPELPQPSPVVESAMAALRRGATPELINEILAGGAVAASFTAAATVAKARIEATTQRLKNEQDAETEQQRIASQERTAALQAREQTKQVRLQAEHPPMPPATD